jgi:predicted nucleotide-binding protein (sugar kinase/HSP70/actin superfamily)
MNVTLEFGEAVRALEEHIEILKQNLLFLMAERRKPESTVLTQKIITIKRELDKAVQERMKLSQIYSRPNSSVVVPAASTYCNEK